MKEYTAGKLAELLGVKLEGDKNIKVSGVARLTEATEKELSYLGDKKYYKNVKTTKAPIIIVGNDFNEEVPEGKALLKCDNPNIIFSKAVELFVPTEIKYEAGKHETAVVADSAQIADSCYIGANVVIEENAVIGQSTVILAGTYIGHQVQIGSDSLIYPNVSIRERCKIGNNVIIHCGATIGADGFGYNPGPYGIQKIPQVGIVRVEDEVEIGANATIDRSRIGETVIRYGTKIDNLVLVAHGADIGAHSMMIGQSAVAGSVKVGQGVILAGQSGVSHHLTIADGAQVAGHSGVTKDVPPKDSVAGTPAETARDFLFRRSLPKKYKQMKEKVSELEETVDKLKNDIESLKKNN